VSDAKDSVPSAKTARSTPGTIVVMTPSSLVKARPPSLALKSSEVPCTKATPPATVNGAVGWGWPGSPASYKSATSTVPLPVGECAMGSLASAKAAVADTARLGAVSKSRGAVSVTVPSSATS
jgi:hypothetical protein